MPVSDPTITLPSFVHFVNVTTALFLQFETVPLFWNAIPPTLAPSTSPLLVLLVNVPPDWTAPTKPAALSWLEETLPLFVQFETSHDVNWPTKPETK